MVNNRQRGALVLEDVIKEDHIAVSIANKWHNWKQARRVKEQEWQEVRNYLYATDTTTTSNKNLPWRNSTTTPKLAQIKDNLIANYKYALFPRRNWLHWIGADEESIEKKQAIQSYMQYVVEQPLFEATLERLLDDFVEYGNAFAMPDWHDDNYEKQDGTVTAGYVGPTAIRISPENIVFDPTAPVFEATPKIIKSLITIGDLEAKLMSRTFADENEKERTKKILEYLKEIRQAAYLHDIEGIDEAYAFDGFSSVREYLTSGVVEILTFYGDLYDENNQKFYRNVKITIADRHKLISIEENPSGFANPPIYHAPWRRRRDNLWGMGPLDNLVGLQYRIDHLENIKADALDLSVFPPLFIKGVVEDFKWGPMEIIRTADPSGDVKPLGPDTSVLNVNLEIARILELMEEMAGAPKEAMGFRTPGEKTAFEVQRLENAASRIFQSKIIQFERDLLEPLLNAMLELAWRNFGASVQYVVNDRDNKIQILQTLSKEEIMGAGRLRPVAARHFVDMANLVQNLSNLKASGLLDDTRIGVHFSGKKIARLLESGLGLDDYNVVSEYVGLAEQQELQTMSSVANEQSMMAAGTPSGLTPDDVNDMEAAGLADILNEGEMVQDVNTEPQPEVSPVSEVNNA